MRNVVVLGPDLVVLSPVTEMVFVDRVPWVNGELTLLSHKRQVFPDPYAAVVEEHVVVRAQAQDVVWRARPVVRGPERPDVRGLRVGPCETLQPRYRSLAALWLRYGVRTAKENTMRKVVVTQFISLDGVMEEPAWTFPYWNDELAKFKGEESSASDALLLGRVTYQGFAAA
jgi:hypothetical protein